MVRARRKLQRSMLDVRCSVFAEGAVFELRRRRRFTTHELGWKSASCLSAPNRISAMRTTYDLEDRLSIALSANIEHRTFNAELRRVLRTSRRRLQRSMLDVRCSVFAG